jgi:hypothetical protein
MSYMLQRMTDAYHQIHTLWRIMGVICLLMTDQWLVVMRHELWFA